MKESSKLPIDNPAVDQDVDKHRAAKVRRALRQEDVPTQPDTNGNAKAMSAFAKDMEELWDNVPL